jgi:hypothetical protein
VTGRPTRATVGGRAYLDLRKAASAAGRPTDEFVQLYALDGFLDRLGSSPHAEHLCPRAGSGSPAARLATRMHDVDLEASDVTNELHDIHRLADEVIRPNALRSAGLPQVNNSGV